MASNLRLKARAVAGAGPPAWLQHPVQRFIHAEASSGILLVIAALVALVWANSPWSAAYNDLWHARLTFDLNFVSVTEDLRHFINDGAMTIFFFVVGLEIKRELVRGELASVRRATLPIAAAAGGMLVPALIYLSWNVGGGATEGWGIPMATDIAFAMGVLALAGPRIPTSLKVFLLALAIVDDLGAILVIAAFYTETVHLEPLLWGGLALGVIVAARLGGVQNVLFYVIPGVLLWLAVLESGVHATLAGVVLAFLTPSGPVPQRAAYHTALRGMVAELARADEAGDRERADLITAEIDRLTDNREPPLDQLESALHPWASFVVVPLFALANAGLDLSWASLADSARSTASLGIATGLVIGKPVGIVTFSWLVVRLGLASLPAGARWRDIAAMGLLAGIGFTVSLFISGLAFDSAALEDEARVGILAASVIAGIAGFIAVRLAQARE
ncbi:MAG: Na+/H+ antiporter NhaA [Dehalococcoidia bacterium]